MPHALKWIGIGAVLALSEKFGSLVGIHPGALFLVVGGFGFLFLVYQFTRYFRHRLQKRSDRTQ